jgi:hypothetical protein
MQICAVGITARRNFEEFALLSGHLSRKPGCSRVLHCKIFPQRVLFYRAINRLPSPCRPRMTPRKKFNAAGRNRLRHAFVLW